MGTSEEWQDVSGSVAISGSPLHEVGASLFTGWIVGGYTAFGARPGGRFISETHRGPHKTLRLFFKDYSTAKSAAETICLSGVIVVACDTEYILLDAHHRGEEVQCVLVLRG